MAKRHTRALIAALSCWSAFIAGCGDAGTPQAQSNVAGAAALGPAPAPGPVSAPGPAAAPSGVVPPATAVMPPPAATGAAAGSAAAPTTMGGATPVTSPAPASSPAAREIPEGFLADAGESWKTLVISRWEVPPGTEKYQCVRFTLPQDVNVSAFRALSPPGTHHTFLMISDTATKPDGTEPCNATTIGNRNLTGSGVGTNDFVMPQGVATQLKKGQQLILNLHLFNVTEKPITGLSGTLIKVSENADVKQFAEGILAGPISLAIPSGSPTTVTGSCTMDGDVTLFGVIPHMHQLGTHLKAVAKSSVMGDVVLSDRPYDFDSQIVYPLDQQIPMKAGDKIVVECTYQNMTGKMVGFGESSLDEMCFAGIYRYPASAKSFICFR